MPTELSGNKVYTILIQINNLTGKPTGVVKPNVPEDPDYRPPEYDPDMCPPPPVES